MAHHGETRGLSSVRQVFTSSQFSPSSRWLSLSSIVMLEQIADACCSVLLMGHPVLRTPGYRSHLACVLWRAMPAPMLAGVSVAVSVLACHVRGRSARASGVVASLLAYHVLVGAKTGGRAHLCWRGRDGLPCLGESLLAWPLGAEISPCCTASAGLPCHPILPSLLFDDAQRERLDPGWWP